MSVFEDLDEEAFTALAPAVPKVKPDVKLSFVTFKPTSPAKLQISFKAAVLEEIGGPRYEVGWNTAKRLLLVKAKDQGPFEAASAPHGKTLLLRMPLPAGLLNSGAEAEPEYYVDTVGKRLLIEVPPEFGRRLALPAPAEPRPAKTVVTPPAPSSHDEIVAGNRELLKALGVTQSFPRELGGEKFTPAEACLLEALFRRNDCTVEALLAATHDPEKGDDDREPKVVDVWITRLRPRLKNLGIEIQTVWGGGRKLDAAGKGRLRELLRDVGWEGGK